MPFKQNPNVWKEICIGSFVIVHSQLHVSTRGQKQQWLNPAVLEVPEILKRIPPRASLWQNLQCFGTEWNALLTPELCQFKQLYWKKKALWIWTARQCLKLQAEANWLKSEVNAVPFATVAECLPGCRWETQTDFTKSTTCHLNTVGN